MHGPVKTWVKKLSSFALTLLEWGSSWWRWGGGRDGAHQWSRLQLPPRHAHVVPNQRKERGAVQTEGQQGGMFNYDVCPLVAIMWHCFWPVCCFPDNGAGDPEEEESVWPVERRPGSFHWGTRGTVRQTVGHGWIFSTTTTSNYFCPWSQRVEAKEKELVVMPAVKGKGKALKVKRETLPTPQGRRVIPRVTSTMKADAKKKVKKPKVLN